MKLAFIIVHFHTPEWTRRAVAAIRREVEAGGFDAELVVVDNGSSPAERSALAALPARIVDAGWNRGYAGGLNLGIASSDADILFLLNPDVVVLPGCVAALVARLREGAAAAGPRFYWDAERRFLLPPTEERTRRSEIASSLAGRSSLLAAWARSRWRRRARRFWLATEPFPTAALSGALLAIRRETLERVGPFDEGYRLYFEETDWLLRLRRAGLASDFVPAAEAFHAYNQSAAKEPAAAGWFAESRRRFFELHYGSWFVRLTRAIERLPGLRTPSAVPEGGPPSLAVGQNGHSAERPLWLEISPRVEGFPAGVARLEAEGRERWTLPPEIWDSLAPGFYTLTLCGHFGRELWRATFGR